MSPITREISVLEGRPAAGFGEPEKLAFRVLRFGFIALPLIAGADKFFNVLANWQAYLSPFIASMLPFSPAAFMRAIGVVEIAAGLLVALNPVWGGRVVMLHLWAIILNLVMVPGFYDIALRDFGLSLGAMALANLGVAQMRARITDEHPEEIPFVYRRTG